MCVCVFLWGGEGGGASVSHNNSTSHAEVGVLLEASHATSMRRQDQSAATYHCSIASPTAMTSPPFQAATDMLVAVAGCHASRSRMSPTAGVVAGRQRFTLMLVACKNHPLLLIPTHSDDLSRSRELSLLKSSIRRFCARSGGKGGEQGGTKGERREPG